MNRLFLSISLQIQKPRNNQKLTFVFLGISKLVERSSKTSSFLHRFYPVPLLSSSTLCQFIANLSLLSHHPHLAFFAPAQNLLTNLHFTSLFASLSSHQSLTRYATKASSRVKRKRARQIDNTVLKINRFHEATDVKKHTSDRYRR